jgi:hypothetical protein
MAESPDGIIVAHIVWGSNYDATLLLLHRMLGQ